MKSLLKCFLAAFFLPLIVQAEVANAAAHKSESFKYGSVILELKRDHAIAYAVGQKQLSFVEFAKFLDSQFGSALGENDPYYVIFRGDVPFGDVVEVGGLLQSKPYFNIRYFILSSDEVSMVEITFDKVYPFSRNLTEKDIDPSIH